MVTKVDETKLLKLKTEADKMKYLSSLEFWEQEKYEAMKDNY